LDITYNQILQSIPDEYQKEANCVLNMDEVAEAVDENESIDPEARLRDEHDILEICSSLVTWLGYLHPSTFEFDQQ
jgi:hypothetical protein